MFADAAAGPELLNTLIPPGAGNFFLKSKNSATRRSVGLGAVDILTKLDLSQLNHADTHTHLGSRSELSSVF